MVNINKFGELEDSLCPKCGDPIKPEWKACPQCATRLSKKSLSCTECGSPLKSGWKACPECGKRVNGGRKSSWDRKTQSKDIQDLFLDALKADDYESAQDILDDGANIDRPTSQGPNALWSACVRADPTQVEWLIEHGANPNDTGLGKGHSNLEAAAGGTVKKEKKRKCLQVMEMLINAGADVNHQDDSRLSIVELAGSGDAQRLLLKHGARRGRRKLMFD